MLYIGICDSNSQDCELLQSLCEEYSRKENILTKCISFATGEAFFDYCITHFDCRFDVLFLEMELNGMDWREIKRRVEYMTNIKEIIFLTNKKEYMRYAFDLKVREFEVKPADKYKVERLLKMVICDKLQDTLINFDNKHNIWFRQIYYFSSNGAYTKVYFCSDDAKKFTEYMSTKSMKYWEEQLVYLPIVRIHKSYMVNLMHVQSIDSHVILDKENIKLPIGRCHKKEVEMKYSEFQIKYTNLNE